MCLVPSFRVGAWQAPERCATLTQEDVVKTLCANLDPDAKIAEFKARGLAFPVDVAFVRGATARCGVQPEKVVSALFDAQGILRGIRLVTDPRPDARNDAEADLRPRTVAHQFGALMAGRFDIEPARDCQSLPLENGESAVGGTAIKLDCLRIDQTAGRTYRLSVRLLRKAGQSGRDPRVPTQLTRNQFESMARLEIMEGH